MLKKTIFCIVALVSLQTAAFGFTQTFHVRDHTGCQTLTFNWSKAPAHLQKRLKGGLTAIFEVTSIHGHQSRWKFYVPRKDRAAVKKC